MKAVDQEVCTPGSTSAPYWTDLGIYYLGASTQVTLAGSASGDVIADGVQVVPAAALNAVTITTPAASTADGATVRVKVTGP